MAYSIAGENQQVVKTQVANVAHLAEDHSCLVSCVSFDVGRGAREGRESAEPSTLLPNQVSQGEGVWKWSRSRCKCAATKTMSLTTTIIGL